MRIVLFLLLFINFVYSKDFKGSGEYVSESKREACRVALDYAKEEAMQYAGTLMLSSFSSTTTATSREAKSLRERKIKQFSMGVTKLKSKKERVKINQKTFVFDCKVDAVFEIDDKSIKKFHNQLLQDERSRQQTNKNKSSNITDKELEKLKLQRDIEKLRLQQKETSGSFVSKTYRSAPQQSVKNENSKSNFGLELEAGFNFGNMKGTRAEVGFGFKNFVFKIGSASNTLNIDDSEDYRWEPSTNLFSYDYSTMSAEMFIDKNRIGLSFGLTIQTIDKESFENDTTSYDTVNGNYLIGGTYNSYSYYKLYFTDVSSWENGSSVELFMALTMKYMKIYLSSTPSYGYAVYKYTKDYSSGYYYRDSSYYESGTLGGYNVGIVFRLPINF